jgi:hypothetical protein
LSQILFGNEKQLQVEFLKSVFVQDCDGLSKQPSENFRYLPLASIKLLEPNKGIREKNEKNSSILFVKSFVRSQTQIVSFFSISNR